MRRLLWVLAVLACCAAPAAFAAEQLDSAEVRHQIKDILAAPEYNRVYAKGEQSGFGQEFLGRLGRWVRDFFNWMRDALALKGDSTGRLASFIFASLVLVGFVAMLVLIIRRLSRSAVRRSDEPLSYELDEAYELPSARPLIREAARLAEMGDYRGAFRCAYMASISYLDDANALRFERSRTNWEYLRELRLGGREETMEALMPITVAFDRKFYGRERCDRQDYLDALAVYERITQEAAA